MNGRPARKVVIAAVIGNALEFYDFTTYAFFAVPIGNAFFPTGNSFTSLLLSVGTYGIGFVMRPVGSIVIGSYGDRAGRRAALLLTVALMALGTLVLAVTPSFASIGLAAPICVVVGRLVQGFALGGEVGPSTALLFEIAPLDKRGLYTSWQPASQGAAVLVAGALGLLLTSVLSPDAMASWGWRVPFALGLAIVPFGLSMRRLLPEPTTLAPAAQVPSAASDPGNPFAPLAALLMHHRRPMIAAMMQILFGAVAAFISGYMTTYATATLHLPATTAIAATLLVGLCNLSGPLVGGWLADRFGSRIAIVVPRLILMLLVYPAFEFVGRQPSAVSLFIATAIMTGLSMISHGAAFAAIAGAFPGAYRSTGLSVSYAIIVSIAGGTTQLLITWFIGITGDRAVPAYYLLTASALSLIALCWLPRTRRVQHGSIPPDGDRSGMMTSSKPRP